LSKTADDSILPASMPIKKPDENNISDLTLVGQSRQVNAALRESFLYETIKFSGTLSILDRSRQVALFFRTQRIRFLQDNVAHFIDRVWGDGVLFAGYYAAGMRILDMLRARSGYLVLLGLPRPFHKGETFNVVTRRKIVGSVHFDEVYWQTSMPAPTELLSIRVLAPHGLTLHRPELSSPSLRNVEINSARRSLELRVREPVLHAPYEVSWHWK
jgi:hypothetical protein